MEANISLYSMLKTIDHILLFVATYREITISEYMYAIQTFIHILTSLIWA